MLIVSNYHYIREDFSSPYPSIFGLTPKQFRMQLEELSKHGKFVSKKELLRFRHEPFDRNYILITFDDGLREQFELAKPILEEMGIPAVFFINTSNFREKEISLVHKIHLLRVRLSSEEILNALENFTSTSLERKERALAISHYNYDPEDTAILKYLLNFRLNIKEQKAFISPLFEQVYDKEQVVRELYFDDKMLSELHRSASLGSHSHRHLPLGLLSTENLENELQQTQDFFRSRFGEISDAISYPYGSLEACIGISTAVEEAGFQLGFTMERAANNSIVKDSLLLSRFDCNDLPSGKNDLFKGEPIFAKPLIRKWHLHEDSTAHQR